MVDHGGLDLLHFPDLGQSHFLLKFVPRGYEHSLWSGAGELRNVRQRSMTINIVGDGSSMIHDLVVLISAGVLLVQPQALQIPASAAAENEHDAISDSLDSDAAQVKMRCAY